MKILFVNQIYFPENKMVWSGTPYGIYTELKKYFDVDVYTYEISLYLKIYEKAIQYYNKIRKKRGLYIYNTSIVAKQMGKRLSKILKESKYDAVVAIGMTSIANVVTNIPIIYYSDATFEKMIDYYWFGLNSKLKKQGNEIQKRALDNASMNVFASEWARNSASQFYNISSDKLRVIKLGANVDTENFKKEKHTNINLLFVGVDWERKGAEIAIKCIKKLNELDSENKYFLNLVGCKNDNYCDSEILKNWGFLNRNIPEQSEILKSLREKSDFFILPTRAECAGMVFCEAAAYGLPSVTYDTGGIPDYVINGVNGYRMPMGADENEFANCILSIVKNKEMERLAASSRELYERELNWNFFGKKLRNIILEVTAAIPKKSSGIKHE